MRAPDYAYGTFVKFWRELGGEFAGKMRLEPAPREARLLEEFESLTLGEIIRLTNKYSSNSMARMLLLSLAVDRYGTPATVANGERALTEWLGRNGIEAPELVLDNGSGLSRLSRISADTMAKVLSFGYQSRYYPELAASLPLGGQDGTLKHRFAEVAAEARIRLKTGHLNGVSAVAGWVVNRSQRPLTVVVMVNHPGAEYGGGQAVIDTVVRWALER
jgi:serine-type D-Ala-D-Ala carboxypeptidase/endopeptidase (penicillin-binding protein 4)